MNKINLEDKIDELKARCKRAGLRVTKQRIEIYKEIFNSKNHPDVETVFEAVRKKLPDVSLDTVYRTLSSLEELQMVFRVDGLLQKTRYDADSNPHCHFLCVKCGEIYDISQKEQFNPDINIDCGEVLDFNLQIRGICNKCLKK